MVETRDHFYKRLKGLGHKHAGMKKGYVTKVDRNGLLTARARRARGGSPLKIILMLVFGFFIFKAFMVAAVGPVTYNERLATLESGNAIEKAGARALGIDPVTEKLADFAGPVMR